MTLPVTAFAAAICALLLIYCAYATVAIRIKHSVSFGDGENPNLLVARRIHANLAEHAPLFLIMLAVLEMANAHHWGITAIAGIFLIGRVLHIVGMKQHHASGNAKLRQAGVVATWLTTLALAFWIIFLFVTQNLL